MKKLNKKSTLELNELLKKYNKNENYPVSIEDLYMNIERYIKAVKDGRMLCSIDSVSKSGMSRTIKFIEMNGTVKNGFRIYNFYQLFCILGYKKVNNSDYFRVNGCGMDMVFHTNYQNIHEFYRMGLITKKECEQLSQKTPSIV